MIRAFSAGEFSWACDLGRRFACPRLVWLTPLASLRQETKAEIWKVESRNWESRNLSAKKAD